ncbi:MAG: hypothetical protein S0880_00230 [Actinomycetota bacterium]|nr:hypothetical protein [Actinomycetota bacterium]
MVSWDALGDADLYAVYVNGDLAGYSAGAIFEAPFMTEGLTQYSVAPSPDGVDATAPVACGSVEVVAGQVAPWSSGDPDGPPTGDRGWTLVDDMIAGAMIQDWGLNEDEARRRVVAQKQWSELEEEILAAAGGDWAGAIVHHETDGSREFLTSSEASAQRLRGVIRQAGGLSEATGTAARVTVVQHSMDELRAAASDLNTALSRSGVAGGTAGVNIVANGLTVTVPTDQALDEARRSGELTVPQSLSATENNSRAEATAAPFREAFAVEVLRTNSLDSGEQACDNSGWRHNLAGTEVLSCDAPLRGGVFMVSSRSKSAPVLNDVRRALCSVGFLVRSLANNLPLVVTAGHCAHDDPATATDERNGAGDRGRGWRTYQPTLGSTHWVGTWWDSVYDARGDMGIVIVPNYADGSGWGVNPRVFVQVDPDGSRPITQTIDWYPINALGNMDAVGVGDYLCRTGAVTFSDCGARTELDGRGGSGALFPTFNDWASCQGDSGGPVYANGRAYGIHQGAENQSYTAPWDVVVPGETAFVDLRCSYESGNSPIGVTPGLGRVQPLADLLDDLRVRLVTTANP